MNAPQTALAKVGASALAIYYGVAQPTISDIKTRRTWHHI